MPRGVYSRPSLDERLWAKVDKTTTCWLWKGSLWGGYGRIWKTGERSSTQVHRISWELVNGPIPEGILVLHKCDNGRCVRPSHLFLGSHQDNTDDMMRKGRHRTNSIRGVEHGRAKLSDDWVREIRSKYLGKGYTQEGLAKEYGISRGHIGRIVNNKIWKHL